MPCPFEHSSGIFFLNIKVPKDLAGMSRATRVGLPVGDDLATVTITDKVFLSLRTRDPALARTRFSEAYAALVRHWTALREGPKPLTHRQLVALAGDAYRDRVARLEADPTCDPDVLMAQAKADHDALMEWKYGDGDGLGEISDESARFYAAIQRPSGPQLLAFETKADVVLETCTVTYGDALEHLFGDDADAICARRQLVIDGLIRAKLLREIAEVVRLAGAKLARNMTGDYAEDENLKRFPAFEPPPPANEPIVVKSRTTMAELCERWRTHHADKRAASTLRHYAPSLQSLVDHLGTKDIRLVTEDDIWAWAEKRRDKDGVAALTVNRNDLVAIAAVFQFATTRAGGRLLASNPARGVKLDLPAREEARDKTFLDHEVRAILRLARGAKGRRRFPKASASRRWAPWICAYTGARIQEVCWLRKEDIWLEGGIWVIRFPRTKEARARLVPIHDALVDEGLIDFWRRAPDGSLFTGDMPQKPGVTRTPAELRASEPATWIQHNVELEDGVSPNHGWRHTVLTIAEGVGISKRHANAIAGHNRKRDASDGYVAYPVNILKQAVDKLPRYAV